MSRFKNFPSCHVHPQSLDSASTPEAFVQREVELDTGVITCTDHGTLAACQKIYDLAHADKIHGVSKPKLIPVLGLEGYFRDDNCPILMGADIPKVDGKYDEYIKYHHITLHFQDYQAYECGIRLLSKADERAEKHGSERKPIFNWENLEELGSYNVTMTTGCLIGMVQRHLLEHQNLAIATKYYERLRSLVKPGNLYVEVFPHDCSRNWVSGVFITLLDSEGKQTTIKFNHKKWLKTNKEEEIRAGQLAKEFARGEHTHLLGVKNYHLWQELPPGQIISCEFKEEFAQNECTWWAPTGDVQAGLNKVMRGLAKKYGDKILIGDDSHYAHPEEKIIQDVRLAQNGQWRFYGSYHRQSSEEAYEYFRTRLAVTESEFEGWVENSREWATRFKDFKFETSTSLPTKFYEPKYQEYTWATSPKVEVRDHSLMYTFELIRKHGRMDWSNSVYVKRLQSEINLLHKNGVIDLLPYFFIDEEVTSLYSEAGLLTGPGRGSAAGLLLTYLLGITHVDPIKYDLSLERFITLDRIRSGKLPDIDQDLPHRDLLTDPDTGWLRKRFGDHFAQISVDTKLKLKSSVKDVARFKLGRVPPDIEAMTKDFEMPPNGVEDFDFVFGYESDEGVVPGSIETDQTLQTYIKAYPEHWEIVQKCLGLARQKSRHPCAYVIANRPIHEFIPLTSISDVKVTSYTASSVESVGGLKMDFLVINSLNDISDAIKMAQERSGLAIPASTTIDRRRVPGHRLLPVDGKLVDIWDLPVDQEVLADIATGRTETVFQYNTAGAIKWLTHFSFRKPDGNYAIDSIESMAAFTALDRPGPLDMFVRSGDDLETKHNLLVEYARRARGATPSPDVLAVFDELLPETYGIMVYQEQLQRVYQQLTGCTGAEAEDFRSDVAKKKKSKIEKAYTPFIEKASQKIGKENAEAAWQFFNTWAKYGFNKSHAVCYAVLGYACAYLKHHYPLEWWCAVLKNAGKKEVNERFWQYAGQFIDLPDVKLSGSNFEIQNNRIRAPLSLLHGIGGAAHTQLHQYAPYTDIDDFCAKIQAHRKATKYLVKRITTSEGKGKWIRMEDPEDIKRYSAMASSDLPDDVRWRLGYNSLHRGIVYTLIVSGALDSLFPGGDRLIDDNLFDFEKALAKATGAKKPQPIDATLLNNSPIARFQRKKAVLPAYGEDLGTLLASTNHPLIGQDSAGPYFYWTNPYNGRTEAMRFATCMDMEQISRQEIESGSRTAAAVAAYIEESRFFKYGDEGREACEVALDVEGGRFNLVKWGGKAKKIPDVFKSDLKGSVAVVVVTKYKQDRPLTIDDLIVVAGPLPLKKSKEEEVEE